MNRRQVLTIAAGTAAAAAGWTLLRPLSAPADPAAVRDRASRLGLQHGLRIDFGAPERFFVPPFTDDDALVENGSMTSVDLVAVPPALDGIEASLAIYPAGYVSRRCQAIFICGSLTLDGAAAGGTYGPAWIILVANPGMGRPAIVETARLGVHHEFSSLIWSGTPGLAARWSALLPSGWKAVRDNAEALKADIAGTLDASAGFLSPYGATTAENDFNTYAETAFTEPERVRMLGQQHPVVGRKLALLIAAYELVDSRIGDVFRRSGLRAFADADALTGSVSVTPVGPSALPRTGN